MELIKGVDLGTAVSTRGCYTEHQAVAMLIEVLHALKTMHDHGLVHRDIKPTSVMLTDENRIKLIDFGCAGGAGLDVPQWHMSLSQFTTYIAPEVGDGK